MTRKFSRHIWRRAVKTASGRSHTIRWRSRRRYQDCLCHSRAPHRGPRISSPIHRQTTRWPRALVPFVCAASLHVAAAFAVVAAFPHRTSPVLAAQGMSVTVESDVIRDIVFIPRDRMPSGGGGGGGNGQAGPIRHAKGVGSGCNHAPGFEADLYSRNGDGHDGISGGSSGCEAARLWQR